MKIVVIGGSGIVGKKLVTILRGKGHEVTAASPSSGVNSITGDGLAQALTGANVVVDVTNAPSREDAAVMAFFDTSTRNLLAAERAASVGHHVALSIVAADRLPDSGYMRAKVNQEKLIKAGGVPYSIVQATQFFEFLGGIADSGAEGDTVRLSTAPMQPMAAEDVAAALANVAVAAPLNATVEVAGRETLSIPNCVGRSLAAGGDIILPRRLHRAFQGRAARESEVKGPAEPKESPSKEAREFARGPLHHKCLHRRDRQGLPHGIPGNGHGQPG